MKNFGNKSWLFTGILLGILVSWIMIRIIRPLMMIKKMQKEINNNLEKGKFSDFQKQINDFQKNFPGMANISEEEINKMIENFGIGKTKNSTKKQIKVKT